MRFRSSDKPPPLATRREQLRLILLIGALGVILFAVKFAGNADFWRGTGLVDDAGTPATADNAPAGEASIDFDVADAETSPLRPDAFRLPAEDRPADSSRVGTDAADGTAARSDEDSGTARNTEEELAPLDVPPALLEPIRDNTLGIRRDETTAYYALLTRLNEASSEAVAEASLGEIPFRVVMVDSDAYRGKVLTVEGELRRLLPLGASPSHPELGTMVEGWLFTADSGNNPWRIVALDAPAKIPRAERIDPPVRVRVSGYFFKREGYASQGGLHTAPLLLTRQLEWLPSPPSAAPSPASTGLARAILGLSIVLAAGLGFMLWRLTTGDARFRQRHLARIASPQRDDVEGLNRLEAVDPGEMLRRLAEEHRDPEQP